MVNIFNEHLRQCTFCHGRVSCDGDDCKTVNDGCCVLSAVLNHLYRILSGCKWFSQHTITVSHGVWTADPQHSKSAVVVPGINNLVDED